MIFFFFRELDDIFLRVNDLCLLQTFWHLGKFELTLRHCWNFFLNSTGDICEITVVQMSQFDLNLLSALSWRNNWDIKEVSQVIFSFLWEFSKVRTTHFSGLCTKTSHVEEVYTCILINAVAGEVSVGHCHEYFSTETSSNALIERKEMVNFIWNANGYPTDGMMCCYYSRWCMCM